MIEPPEESANEPTRSVHVEEPRCRSGDSPSSGKSHCTQVAGFSSWLRLGRGDGDAVAHRRVRIVKRKSISQTSEELNDAASYNVHAIAQTGATVAECLLTDCHILQETAADTMLMQLFAGRRVRALSVDFAGGVAMR